MKIHILDSSDWPDDTLSGKIVEAITEAHNDAKKLIPKASDNVNYIVQPSKYDVIQETGVLGYSYNTELVKISFDYNLPYGEKQLLEYIRATVFHEYNHVARWYVTKYDNTLLNYSVTEGLATVFERDFANIPEKPLWGEYESDIVMQIWLNEVEALQDDWSQKDKYAFDHSDGRKWVLYKLGTWLVDNAIQKSGISIAGLTALPAKRIIELAEIQ